MKKDALHSFKIWNGQRTKKKSTSSWFFTSSRGFDWTEL